MRRPGWGVLQERDFRLLFTGQVVSQFGDSITPVALAFAILDLTGRAGDLGYVFAARSVPLVGFLLIGGVFADRLPRRAVMVGGRSDSPLHAGLDGGSPALGPCPDLGDCRAAGVARDGDSVLQPGGDGADAAGRKRRASARREWPARPLDVGFGHRRAGDLGSARGGSRRRMGARRRLGHVFSSARFGLARLRLPARVKLPPQSFARDLFDGWTEFTSRTWVWVIVVCAAIGNGFSRNILRARAPRSRRADLGGPGAWAVILTSFSVGGLVGGFAVLRIKPARPLYAACIAVLPWSFPVAMLALHAPVVAIAAVGFIAGAGPDDLQLALETTLQRHVPDASLSRVSAYDWFGSLLMQPLGFAFVGPAVVLFGQYAVALDRVCGPAALVPGDVSSQAA